MIRVPHFSESVGCVILQSRRYGMAVLAAIKSFPARPRHLGLGHVHDLLGLLYIGSSTFRGETIEIKPQDHIDVKHDSGRKIAGQRI